MGERVRVFRPKSSQIVPCKRKGKRGMGRKHGEMGRIGTGYGTVWDGDGTPWDRGRRLWRARAAGRQGAVGKTQGSATGSMRAL